MAANVAKSSAQSAAKPKGLEFARVYTRPGVNPLDVVSYTNRDCVITNPDGSVVFKMEGAEIPAELVAARDRHRRLQVLPQGRPPRRQEAAARRASARSSTASRTPSARPASASAATSPPTKDADTFEAELSLPARPPVRRVQLAGVVQLRPLPRATASRARGGNWALGRAEPTRRRDRRDRRTPTSARSARRASSRRSTTT